MSTDIWRNPQRTYQDIKELQNVPIELERIKYNLDQFKRLKRDEDVNPIHGIIAILADQVAALTLVVERLAK